jgi:RNA polymerase sigma-70 factor (ECF subfamily)
VSRDAELLEAWRAGDRRAGRELFERHAPSVSRFFRNKVDGDIDDLVQRTFLSCVESKDKLREGASFRAYVLTVARNKLYDHYLERRRQADRVDPLTNSVIDLGASPSVLAAASQREHALLVALRRLPIDLQTALELHYWEDLTTNELAQVLGIPQGTVKTRLFRARESLREVMRIGDARAPPKSAGDTPDPSR